MAEKDDLGLSLSLSFPQNHHSLQLNLMPSSACSTSPSGFSLQKTPWNEALFPSSGAFCLDSCNFHGLKVSDLVKHACFYQKRKKIHFLSGLFPFSLIKKKKLYFPAFHKLHVSFFFFSFNRFPLHDTFLLFTLRRSSNLFLPSRSKFQKIIS